jgi:transposase InsO family protein
MRPAGSILLPAQKTHHLREHIPHRNGFNRLAPGKGVLASMSGRGNCDDNVMMESVFKR